MTVINHFVNRTRGVIEYFFIVSLYYIIEPRELSYLSPTMASIVTLGGMVSVRIITS